MFEERYHIEILILIQKFFRINVSGVKCVEVSDIQDNMLIHFQFFKLYIFFEEVLSLMFVSTVFFLFVELVCKNYLLLSPKPHLKKSVVYTCSAP